MPSGLQTNNIDQLILQHSVNIKATLTPIAEYLPFYRMPETVLVIGGTGAQGVPVVKGRTAEYISLAVPVTNSSPKLLRPTESMPYASSRGLLLPRKLLSSPPFPA